MSAAAATGMGAPTTTAATAMATAAVPAASRCNSYALAQSGLGFFIEDVEGGQADVGDSSSPRKIRRALSCDTTFVGAVAEAPPVMAKDTPAAPNAKAALLAFRFGPRFASTIMKSPGQIAPQQLLALARAVNP